MRRKRTGCKTPTFRKPCTAPAPKPLYEEKLLPCPFCGGKAQILNDQKPFERRRHAFVTCLVCGVETPRIARSRKEAIAAWNRRADEEHPWPKENPHVIAHHVGGYQPTKTAGANPPAPPTSGSNAQNPFGIEVVKRFFSPEAVRAMSPAEVRKNYEAILQSMTKWH